MEKLYNENERTAQLRKHVRRRQDSVQSTSGFEDTEPAWSEWTFDRLLNAGDREDHSGTSRMPLITLYSLPWMYLFP
jgi:hypothetical protein